VTTPHPAAYIGDLLGRQNGSGESSRRSGDADQTASDADQTASDADQTASDADAMDAASDRRASELDQAIADRQLRAAGGMAELEAYEAARHAREVGAISRRATQTSRAETARARLETAAGRDAIAARRDAIAARRDADTAMFEQSIVSSGAPLAEQLEKIRARSAADRARAAADRERAALDRASAAHDRAAAARDRAVLEAALDSAHLDDLTGAFRREAGQLALRHEIERAQRADGRFMVAFIDVDGLKRVNDEWGHAAGDKVLTDLVAVVRSRLRPYDPIVRYGGDEFVCGLGGVGAHEVEARFDAIRQQMRDRAGVGVSVGLALLGHGDTLEELIARADTALLIAKNRRDE